MNQDRQVEALRNHGKKEKHKKVERIYTENDLIDSEYCIQLTMMTT